MSRRVGFCWNGLTLWVLLAACSRPATPPPSATDLIHQSATVLQNLQSVHFTIDRTGAPAYVDPDNVYVFRRAVGDYRAPDAAQATVRIIGPALVAEVQVVSLGDQYWETNPLTGHWASYAGLGYNPARLFDADTGLAVFMQTDLVNLQLVGLEELADLPGERLWHITATAPGAPVLTMTAGLVGRGAVNLDWWIDPVTAQILRLQVVEPETDLQDPTVWIIDFDHFDAELTIEAPRP